MQKIAGLITESQLQDKLKENSSDDSYLPLTPDVKQFIDDSIADIRNSSDDKEWEYLKQVEFWEQDFEENMLVTLSDKYPNAYMISPEVTDYIGSKIYGDNLNENQLNENESVSELSEERYSEIDGFVDDALVNDFINATEAIQIKLGENGVDAPEMYQYLVTIMLNQA